jgi:hypothetical protein
LQRKSKARVVVKHAAGIYSDKDCFIFHPILTEVANLFGPVGSLIACDGRRAALFRSSVSAFGGVSGSLRGL